MAHFYNITAEEMTETLTAMGFQKLELQGVKELTFGKRADCDGTPLTMRVFTGIVNGQSRGVGQDAIRVGLFTKLDDGAILSVAGTRRVHRVAGWKANLQNRISELKPQKCTCGKIMVLRKNKRTNEKFYGCTAYPNCKHTINLKKDKAA